MGERVWAAIDIRIQDQKRFEKLVDFTFEQIEVLERENLVQYYDSQVNYGIFGFEQDLQKHGIAYDKSYDAGSDWDAGVEYFRPGLEVVNIGVTEERTKLHIITLLESKMTKEQIINRLKEETCPYNLNDTTRFSLTKLV